MGTWGFGIFEDDFTLDIKDYYKQFKDEGVSVNQSVARLKKLYNDIILDEDFGPDLEPLFYIGLAASLIESKELLEEIKYKAIEHISSGNGLDLWKEAGIVSLLRRKLEISKFKKRLMKAECIIDQRIIDEKDLNSERFDPSKQNYHVYEFTFASGKKLIGNTVHPELRELYFRKNPLK